MTSRARRTLAATVAVLAVAGACSSSRDASPPRAKGDPLAIDTDLIASLEAFDACDDLLGYLRTEGAKIVGPYGFSGGDEMLDSGTADASTATAAAGPARESSGAAGEDSAKAPAAPPQAGVDYSATNVAEEGVDEPDVVKTDGRRLVTIAGGLLRVVDLTGAQARLAASMPIDDGQYLDGQLLLSGDRVLVLRSAAVPVAVPRGRPLPASGIREGDAMPVPYVQARPRTVVNVVDISDIAAPTVIETVTFDGGLVASRMVGGVARLVLRSGPPDLPFLYPSGSEASVAVAEQANRDVVAGSTVEDWLPGFAVGNNGEQRLTECRDVRRPEVFSGVGMLSVVTLDAEDPRPGPAATVIGAGEMVYASVANLYVTSTAWPVAPAVAGKPESSPAPPAPPTTATEIHRFDIRDDVRTSYVASGRVSGRLLNSWSMSELDGDLRVATTDDATQQSAVTVLRARDEVLGQIGRVDGLGVGERIYAVRFLGDRGYVVTFRQTDPLYVIDLADPAAPVVRGELKIPGYSAYLHPIGDHRLLGVGQDATEQGRVQGLQLSLFDVSDPANPVRLANAVLPQARSEAEYDHHAFLWWGPTKLAMVPVQTFAAGSPGAIGYTVGAGDITELGRVVSPSGDPIRRSIVVGERIILLSEQGISTNDLTTLSERSRLAY